MQQPPELTHFVREALNRGQSRQTIEAQLAAADWTSLEIQTALAGWDYCEPIGAVPRPQRSTSAWDALFYVMLFAAFGLMIGHAMHLMLGVITFMMPEAGDSYSRYRMNGLRWSMAAVMVFTPAFLWLHWKDARASQANPVRRFGTIRRWLTATALLAAALTLACDSIYVIYAFLTGELTPRFIVKAIAVALMAGTVLYYFRQERQTEPVARFNPGAWLAAGLTLLALSTSLWLSGGPLQGQKEARDDIRLRELRIVREDVAACKSFRTEGLPETLAPMSCARAPQDLTGLASAITYERLEQDRFEICVQLEAPDRAGNLYDIHRKGSLHCTAETLE